MTSDIWISEKVKFDYLKNEKSFRNETKNIFLLSKVLFFRHKKETSKNVLLHFSATTFKYLLSFYISNWRNFELNRKRTLVEYVVLI